MRDIWLNGDHLRRARQRKGLTQPELAERMADLGLAGALSASNISKMETGQASAVVNEQQVIALAFTLGVTVSALLSQPVTLAPSRELDPAPAEPVVLRRLLDT